MTVQAARLSGQLQALKDELNVCKEELELCKQEAKQAEATVRTARTFLKQAGAFADAYHPDHGRLGHPWTHKDVYDAGQALIHTIRIWQAA